MTRPTVAGGQCHRRSAATAGIVGVGKDGAIDLYNYGTKPALVVVDLTGSYYAY